MEQARQPLEGLEWTRTNLLGREVQPLEENVSETRKLGVSFLAFLQDRVSGLYTIPPLSDLIRIRAQETNTTP